MDCNNCKEKRAEPVSFVVFESTKATMERTIRRLWILILVLVIMLVGTNVAWIYYESHGTLAVLHPRLYEGVMREVEEG